MSAVEQRVAGSKRWRRWGRLVLSMSGARLLALAFGAVGSVWAARCLGPEKLGVSGMVLSLVGQTGLAVAFIHPALLVREYKSARGSERTRLLSVHLSVTLVGALFFSLVGGLLMAGGVFPREYAFAGWFYLPLVLFPALQPLWVFQAEERQGAQAFLAALQPGLMAVLYLVFFRPGMAVGSDLVVASVVSLAMTGVYAAAMQKWFSSFRDLFTWTSLRASWGYFLRSSWLYAAGLAAYVYTTLELPMIGWLRSLPEMGCYRTAFSVVGAAQAFLTISPALLYPRFIEWRKRGEEFLWQRQKKLGFLVGGAALLCSAAAFLVMPVLHPLVFGEPFRSAGLPVAILLTAKFLVVVHGIFVWGLRTDPDYDRRTSLCMIAVAVFSVSANLLVIPRYGMIGSATVNVVSEGLLLTLSLGMSLGRIRRIRAGRGGGNGRAEEAGEDGPMEEGRVDLCVVTFRRPASLEALLRSFERLQGGGPFRVVVVDNDPEGSARPVVEAFAQRVAYEVVYDVEPGRGISSARNRALQNVASRFFAFVDDDEIVEPGWAVAMRGAISHFGADVVFGMVRERHPDGTARWLDGRELQYLLGGRLTHPTGEWADRGATNNVWARTTMLGDPREKFDPAFNLTGGGDTEFFHRLHLRGARMIWCGEAAVVEEIPEERVTLQWLLRRAFRDGEGFARVFLGPLRPWGKAAWYGKKTVHLALGGAAPPVRLPLLAGSGGPAALPDRRDPWAVCRTHRGEGLLRRISWGPLPGADGRG